MRRLRPLPVVACVLVLGTWPGVPSPAAAAEPSKAAPKPDPEESGPTTPGDVQTLPGGAKRGVLQGRIDAVNPSDGAVVIAPANREERIRATIAAGIPVFVEGRLGDRTALKEGQQVRASYEERDGRTRLRWIEVHDDGDLDAPPGVGGSREGVGGTPGGAHAPTTGRTPRGRPLPLLRTASNGALEEEAPTPPTSPQGSTGIHGRQIPGDPTGESGEEAPADGDVTGEPPAEDSLGASGVQETEEMFAPPTTPGLRVQPGQNEVDGVVVRANVADHELVIEREGRQLTLQVPAGSPVLIEGRRGTLDSLVAGTPVRASLATQDERPIAVFVETLEELPAKGGESERGGRGGKGAPRPPDSEQAE